MTIPKIIFIIPYKNRYHQKIHFDVYMKYIMEDYNKDDYEIYYSHQCDNRHFNRGGIKNLGFLAMMKKYPNDFKNITFVFNDVDTLPFLKNQLNYETTKGNIKHFYGFDFTLGGIISVNGDDFLKMNGFPNYWGWGLEDNRLQQRAKYFNINIDRSTFYDFHDQRILNFDKNPNKIVTKNPVSSGKKSNTYFNCGLSSLCNINYKIENEYINIYNFNDAILPYEKESFYEKNCETEGSMMRDKSRFSGSLKMRIGINQ